MAVLVTMGCRCYGDECCDATEQRKQIFFFNNIVVGNNNNKKKKHNVKQKFLRAATVLPKTQSNFTPHEKTHVLYVVVYCSHVHQ